MTEFLPILKRANLFSGLSDAEITATLKCLNAAVKDFNKGDIIFADGDAADFMGVILSGEIQTQKTDYDGNANIVSKLFPADIIAASVCYSTENRLPFDVVCASDCTVIKLSPAHLIRPCQNACVFHNRLIQNLLNIIADRNMLLAAKINILTKRTVKEKILSFLHAQSKRTKNKRFSIALSRRQMAEYLSVNRSALSRELCNLRDEGLLEFEQNSFFLK